MTDTHESHHAPADPNTAPMRQEVRFEFSASQLLFAWALGAIAIVGGTVFGILLVNN